MDGVGGCSDVYCLYEIIVELCVECCLSFGCGFDCVNGF